MEAKKILAGKWAENGDREDIPAADRTAGYVDQHSVVGGREISRRRFNQKMRELDGFAVDWMCGIHALWDPTITYPYRDDEWCFAVRNGALYRNTRTTTNEDPATSSAWRKVLTCPETPNP